jgi:hypothetical protein
MERSNLKYDFVPKTSVIIDTGPIAGKLTNFLPVALELISGSDLEPLWDRLVSSYHYLGYQNLLGRSCISGKAVVIDRLVSSSVVDSSEIRRELDLKAPFSIEKRLRETAKWYMKKDIQSL